MKRVASAAINDTNTSSESQSDGSESVGKQCNLKRQKKIPQKRMYKSFLPLGLPVQGLA